MTDDPTRKLIHDLRNALGPAMMLAERLSMSTDPSVQRSGRIILDSLDNAIEVMRQHRTKASTEV